MKKILYFAMTIMVCLVSCDPNGQNAPESENATTTKVKTGDVLETTCYSAVLQGNVNLDITTYDEIKVGLMFAETLDEMNDRSAQKINANALYGNKFEIEISNLSPETEYYYCTYVYLNDIQYEFGEIKKFMTLEYPKFSVSANKQVSFSRGNLQYHPYNDEWRFASSQLTYIGYNNENIRYSYSGWIDLFGWGTGNNPTLTSSYSDDYYYFSDWGKNKIGDEDAYTWRTMTSDEWKYLLKERKNYSSLQGIAEVDGVNGLILLPDGWICPRKITFVSGTSNQSFDAKQWKKLEDTGAVFLPAAGMRSKSGSYIYCDDIGNKGYYWSSTSYDNSNYRYALSHFCDPKIYSEEYWTYTHANQLTFSLGVFFRLGDGKKNKHVQDRQRLESRSTIHLP